jgi:hypothetical protein
MVTSNRYIILYIYKGNEVTVTLRSNNALLRGGGGVTPATCRPRPIPILYSWLKRTVCTNV